MQEGKLSWRIDGTKDKYTFYFYRVFGSLESWTCPCLNLEDFIHPLYWRFKLELTQEVNSFSSLQVGLDPPGGALPWHEGCPSPLVWSEPVFLHTNTTFHDQTHSLTTWRGNKKGLLLAKDFFMAQHYSHPFSHLSGKRHHLLQASGLRGVQPGFLEIHSYAPFLRGGHDSRRERVVLPWSVPGQTAKDTRTVFLLFSFLLPSMLLTFIPTSQN